MGALPCLRARNGQVDDVQLVEAAALDPHIAVLVAGRHGHKVQRHRRCKAVAMLVVGVVAAQLGAARCRVHLHLPPRAKVQLKLLQCRAVPCPLPLQLLCPVQRPESFIPSACRDLATELCTGCHCDPSSCAPGRSAPWKAVCRFVMPIVMHPPAVFNFYCRNRSIFGVQLKE